jgi:hypothetical protein
MMPVRCAGKAACRSGSGLNEGLGLAEGKPAGVEQPKTRRTLPAPRCRRSDDQELAVDLAEARRRLWREPYSAAAAPDWLLGRALCALPDVRALEWLRFWPGACWVRGRLPTSTSGSARCEGDQSLAVEGLERSPVAREELAPGLSFTELPKRGAFRSEGRRIRSA